MQNSWWVNYHQILMVNWNLLIINGSSHLIDLDLEIIEIKNFGRFPSSILQDYSREEEFEILGRKCKLVKYVLSDLQSNIKRGPQIISPKDIAWIIYKSGLSTGDTVVEAGSGSAALTLALAQSVAPKGKVITFETNSRHFKISKRNIQMSPWSNLVDIRNDELNDQIKPIKTSSVILDLPNPWEFVQWSQSSLRIGGFMICYLPTVNQVQNLLNSLGGWKEVETIEIIQRSWQAKSEVLRPHSNMLGHTGFIVSARWNG